MAEQAQRGAKPEPSRPNIPYGLLDSSVGVGLLPWSRLSEQMGDAHCYWVGTTRSDGRPHVMPVWGVVLILGREFLVTALRGLIETKGIPFPADRYGKIKMVLQTVYVLVLVGAAGAIPEWLGLSFLIHLRNPWVVIILFWIMIGLTVISGINYCIRARKLLRGTA